MIDFAALKPLVKPVHIKVFEFSPSMKPEDAQRIRDEDKRLDRRLIVESGEWGKWSDVEKDDTRGRALPEHMTAAIKGGGAK